MRRELQLFHAFKMVRRNVKSYAMLSITIILSFSVLLGYLLLNDSTGYNNYKELYSTPYQIVMAYTYDARRDILQRLVSKAKEAQPDCYGYSYVTAESWLPQHKDVSVETALLPENETLVFQEMLEESNSILYAKNVTVVKGKEFPLQSGEAILNESAYLSLFGDTSLPIELTVSIPLQDGTSRIVPLQVVGVSADIQEGALYVNDNGQLAGKASIYTPASTIQNIGEQAQGKCSVLFYSERPEEIVQFCKRFQTVLKSPLVLHAVCSAQSEANQLLQGRSSTKAMFAIVLLLILGVNLFGCFSNALNDRRFEIGVKRAIGASPISIVGQFLAEGICVTLLNILISIVIVADLAIVYKCYQLWFCNEQWIVCLSKYSSAQFLVSSIGLTLLFSLVFAYQSTQVEIVAHLKAE